MNSQAEFIDTRLAMRMRDLHACLPGHAPECGATAQSDQTEPHRLWRTCLAHACAMGRPKGGRPRGQLQGTDLRTCHNNRLLGQPLIQHMALTAGASTPQQSRPFQRLKPNNCVFAFSSGTIAPGCLPPEDSSKILPPRRTSNLFSDRSAPHQSPFLPISHTGYRFRNIRPDAQEDVLLTLTLNETVPLDYVCLMSQALA